MDTECEMKREKYFPANSLYRDIPVVDADIEQGLTSEQVVARQNNGLRNVTPASNTKSEQQIVREKVFTFFNLIFIVLAVALLIVGSFKNMTFLIIAVINTVIGIVQEIRAKRAVDKLTLVAAGRLRVIRDGKRHEIPTDQLVRDDIVEFAAGNQICADAIVRDGQMQVNESLLTGEADAIIKNPGDQLKSGSFVISGRCTAQLTQVGADSYAAKLAAEARADVKSTSSEMMNSLTKLITVVGIALIPMGIILFIRQMQEMPFRNSVEKTVAALIGMIPEGLYLLTSVAIAVSSLKLTKRRVLVQDMNCIETLAHVDILCVDKTGTITEPRMEVSDVFPLETSGYSYEDIEKILAAFYSGQEPDNETAKAMTEQFGLESDWKAVGRIPFSSSSKWSSADFGEHGQYIIGAPEFIMGDRYDSIRGNAEPWSARGCRVLLLAAYDAKIEGRLESRLVKPIALIFLNNLIREDAPATFKYFAEQGVSIRVISGDNPITVSEVASRAGILNADKYIDTSVLITDEDFNDAVQKYTVFGRVTPDQKRKLVRAFQSQGHTVAMTGDGVNDVLALKDSDCGIAMASGSQAASQVSQIVLLDSQFSAMPSIVAEGRRVINNIQRAASLFLVKNIFSFSLALLLLFINMPFPMQAIQLSLISALTIGVPAFFLALEPNYARVEGKFMRNVIRRAMPGGLTNLILVLIAGFFTKVLELPQENYDTIAVWVVATVGFVTLFTVCRPFTKLRIVVFSAMLFAMLVALFFLTGIFELVALDGTSILVLIVLMIACPTLYSFFLLIFDRQMRKHDRKEAGKAD
ncbi:MAG: HAD-IC family P-type ATPase [Oscillospiraceae bacterium]|nr:HAD-IC family P-type ATPase [Oscillospiraceae bacterium]